MGMVMFKHIIAISMALLLLIAGTSSKAGNTATFVAAADIHFDPFLTCANQSPCPLIQQLEAAPSSQWPAILATTDTAAPQYKQDTNYVLLASSIDALQHEAIAAQAQFVLIQGDLLAHHYQEKYQNFSALKTDAGYQAFVQKTMEFMTNLLQQKFPNTDVYFTAGNNDSYQGDNIAEPDGAFFHDMGNLWAQLIYDKTSHQAMQSEFTHAGYYAIQRAGLLLVMLNTNIFSRNSSISAAIVSQEFDWLEQQLAAARSQHLQVLLVMHIPPGIDAFASLKQQPYKIIEMWQPEYTQRFNMDIADYAENIIGMLTAHTHADSFQLLTNRHGIKIPVSSTPSITPINGNNPGFKVFHYDATTLTLRDYQTFYAKLSILQWQKEYDFNEIYQPGCHNCTLTDGMELLTVTGELANTYQLYYDMQSNTDPIHNSYNPYYWCQHQTITATEYQNCISANLKLQKETT
jgi:sphingomyelin phosphodiesterase acid-like 3